MSLVFINVKQKLKCVVSFTDVFSAGWQTCLVAWFMPLDWFAVRLKKRVEKKLHNKFFVYIITSLNKQWDIPGYETWCVVPVGGVCDSVRRGVWCL